MVAPEIRQRVRERFEDLYERHQQIDDASIASFYSADRGYYGPEQAGPERDQFAIAVATLDGQVACIGDHDVSFAIQSISKVFAYGLALEDQGRDQVLSRVGVEPSGDAFNSIVFDERHHRPYNPMVNAGALVTTDMIAGKDPNEKLDRLLQVLRVYAGNDTLRVDQETFAGELRNADRNRAITYLMRSQGMICGDAEAALATYLQQCSVTITCRDLALMAATLAGGGVNPVTGERAIAESHIRDILSVIYTCGMYDFAGEWAYEVGVPAKSGVSGGILCVVPGKMGIAVFSPGLDPYGNSVRGERVCREFSERLGLHTFATEAEDALTGLDQGPYAIGE